LLAIHCPNVHFSVDEVVTVDDGRWRPTLDESDLREADIGVAVPHGISIVLIKKNGRVYALRNRCAHMGCTLAGGRLDGYTLQCPCHEWRFDITSGEFVDAREIRIPTYNCRSHEGKIWILLEDTQ
jgi:3-phenylpropionate/trans-cinnamate dioxygenase ferredoxin subunit